jgi:signal transduction histidine kinase
MTQEARAMTSLVDDLLLLTRDKTQALNRSLVNFSELSTDEVFRAQLSEPRASITSVVEPDLMVRGDVERLHQVLRNLLENAVNYTPHGKINVLVAVGDGVATLVVRDSGIGIPEVDLPKVFDRFFRSEEARSVRREGVGLGLAIVKYVIEAHGGSVSASSESEGGAVFTVSLPLAEAPPRLLADIRQVS